MTRKVFDFSNIQQRTRHANHRDLYFTRSIEIKNQKMSPQTNWITCCTPKLCTRMCRTVRRIQDDDRRVVRTEWNGKGILAVMLLAIFWSEWLFFFVMCLSFILWSLGGSLLGSSKQIIIKLASNPFLKQCRVMRSNRTLCFRWKTWRLPKAATPPSPVWWTTWVVIGWVGIQLQLGYVLFLSPVRTWTMYTKKTPIHPLCDAIWICTLYLLRWICVDALLYIYIYLAPNI